MIIDSGIDKYLGINNLSEIVLCDDIIGIWSQLEVDEEYPFSKVEKEMIKNIRRMNMEEFNEYTVYKYGLYVSSVVGSIKGISYKDINDIYHDLVITSRRDIDIKAMDIANALNSKPGKYISDIFNEIEYLIVMKKIRNNKEDIIKYIKKHY